MKKLLALTAIISSFASVALAQDAPKEKTEAAKPARAHNKIYTSSSLDGALFSLNTDNTTGVKNILRFSYFVNTGLNFNYDFNNHIGIYAGIGIKNLGFIDKMTVQSFTNPTTFYSVTTKHRVYAAGIPVGLKIGNLTKKSTFALIGAGADFPVNYKEKTFTGGRKNKAKMNEWFSDRTEPMMPYVFAGISLKGGLTIRAQYYVGNFMNRSYTTNGVTVYNYDTHLAFLSLSYNVKGKNDGSMKANIKKIMHPDRKK